MKAAFPTLKPICTPNLPRFRKPWKDGLEKALRVSVDPELDRVVGFGRGRILVIHRLSGLGFHPGLATSCHLAVMTERVSIRRGGKDWGSFPSREIKLLIVSGDLLDTDLAWYEGLPEWQPLRELAEFAGAFAKRGAIQRGDFKEGGAADKAPAPSRIDRTRPVSAWTVVISILLLVGIGAPAVVVGLIYHLLMALVVLFFAGMFLLGVRDRINRGKGRAAAEVHIEPASGELAMGAPFEGKVVLTAKTPLRACQSELSLTLYVRNYEEGGAASGGGYRWIAWGSCEDLVPRKPVDLFTGETSARSFSVIAPSHERDFPDRGCSPVTRARRGE